MPRVKLTNLMPSTQGFYGREDHELTPGYDMSAVGAKMVPPGGSIVLTFNDADLREAEKLGAGIRLEPLPALGEPAPPPTSPKPIPPQADDGSQAKESLKPPAGHDNTAAAAAPAPGSPERDAFDDMDDDALRAFITDRDGEAPHHRLGRERLLKRARGQEGGQVDDGGEAV